MATKLGNTIFSDATKIASVLGFFSLYLDFRAEQRTRKWHEAGEKESDRRHRESQEQHKEMMQVWKEILEQLKVDSKGGNG